MMKAIPYVLLLPLALIVLLTQCKKEPEIELVDIPDPTFLNALIDLGVDTDGDGNINPTEAGVVTSLNLGGRGIRNMTGINAFVHLNTLICSNNNLAHLEISNFTVLKELWCNYNSLTNLYISNCPALNELYCNGNSLTNLDISECTALEVLECSINSLTNLNISDCSALERLSLARNQLDTLDLSNKIALIDLNCSSNKLNTLDISNNTVLHYLYISEMPSLHKVCVLEIPYPPEGCEVYKTGSPNVYFTTECSE